jgi:hypothetical protein
MPEAKQSMGGIAQPLRQPWLDWRTAFDCHCWGLQLIRRLGVATVTVCCWAGLAAADTLLPAAPIKIAVFPFELEDFSAAGQKGLAPTETSYLAQATEEARQQLLKSGRYSLVDAVGADPVTAKEPSLRNCGGCEAPIALKLGADQAMIGVVTKISMTEYTVRLRISDSRNGHIISSFSTDLRMGADYSWSRGVRWLMQNRILTSH